MPEACACTCLEVDTSSLLQRWFYAPWLQRQASHRRRRPPSSVRIRSAVLSVENGCFTRLAVGVLIACHGESTTSTSTVCGVVWCGSLTDRRILYPVRRWQPLSWQALFYSAGRAEIDTVSSHLLSTPCVGPDIASCSGSVPLPLSALSSKTHLLPYTRLSRDSLQWHHPGSFRLLFVFPHVLAILRSASYRPLFISCSSFALLCKPRLSHPWISLLFLEPFVRSWAVKWRWSARTIPPIPIHPFPSFLEFPLLPTMSIPIHFDEISHARLELEYV